MSRLALVALLLLAGCGETEKAPAPQQAQQKAEQPAEPARPQATEFTGRWAVNQRMCRTGWWDFGETEIKTAGELHCSIDSQERTPHRVKLDLSCMGEGLPSTEIWRLRMLDGARLSVTRDAAPPVILERCPAS